MLEISVIIPVYNAEELLEKAVDSALQFDEVKEVLVIEDGSPDQSLLVCQRLEKKHPERVKLYQHPDKGNHGAGATRNLGLDKAKSEFIAFLDADDYYLPNRFDEERKLFQDNKIEGVFGAIGTEFLSEKGKEEFQEKFKGHSGLTTVNYSAEGRDVFTGLLGMNEKTFGSFFSLIALTIRKSALNREKLKFNEALRVHQDTDFITKLAFHCYLKTGSITEAVSIRGVHDENRITKIENYSALFYKNIFLLETSKYFWAKEQKHMPKDIISNIKLSYNTFRLANEKGLKRYIDFGICLIQNPKLLKTRYRFHALRRL